MTWKIKRTTVVRFWVCVLLSWLAAFSATKPCAQRAQLCVMPPMENQRKSLILIGVSLGGFWPCKNAIPLLMLWTLWFLVFIMPIGTRRAGHDKSVSFLSVSGRLWVRNLIWAIMGISVNVQNLIWSKFQPIGAFWCRSRPKATIFSIRSKPIWHQSDQNSNQNKSEANPNQTKSNPRQTQTIQI